MVIRADSAGYPGSNGIARSHPFEVTSAAYRVDAAYDGMKTELDSRSRDFHGLGKFGNADAEIFEESESLDAVVVMTAHRNSMQLALSREFAHPFQGRTARRIQPVSPGLYDRPVGAGAFSMVHEGQEVAACAFHEAGDNALRALRRQFIAQKEAVVDQEAWRRGSDGPRKLGGARIVAETSFRMPEGNAVELGGDSASGVSAIGLADGQFHRDVDVRPDLNVPFDDVAMQIDEAREEPVPLAVVDRVGPRSACRIDRDDEAVFVRQ